MPDNKKEPSKVKSKKLQKEFDINKDLGYPGTIEEYYEEFYGPVDKGYQKGGMGISGKKKTKNKSKEDPYTSRNEFKPGFYDQPDKPPITDDTMYGIGKSTPPTYEVSPDNMNYSKGGSVTVKTKLGKTKPTKLY